MRDRIQILGGAGSGKTTLATKSAQKHELPHRKLDDVFWYDIKSQQPRSILERDRLLEEWVSDDKWIIDGIFWQDWVRPAFERAELIVVLDIPELTRHIRVIKRHFQLLSKNPLIDYGFFFPTLWPLLRLNRTYQKGPFREMTANLLEYREKVVVCKTNQEASKFLEV